MNNKDLINFLAFVSDSNSKPIDELNSFYNLLKETYSDIELSVYLKILISDLNRRIIDSENNLNISAALGSPNKILSFTLENQRHEKDYIKVLKFWKLSLVFLEHKINTPVKPDIVLDFDNLPDYLTPDKLSTLMGWTKSTIATKHSKGELACVEGTRLTPKNGLREYLERKTKGLIEKPEQWFEKNLRKRK